LSWCARPNPFTTSLEANSRFLQPFVDDDHQLQNFFPPRVWAIRIPVILILVASAVVGSFLGMVMIRSNRKKAAKKAAAAKKKA
jgi:dolichyl-phosphate mannosyltransferase polypeptide 2 regulatory subunit